MDIQRFPELLPFIKFGKFTVISRLLGAMIGNDGACLAPANVYYHLLGMERLGLRMEAECRNARLHAEFLFHIKHCQVNYPGIKGYPGDEVEKEILQCGYGASVTIRAGMKERASQIMNRLKIAKNVSNIGDTKTLVVHPESTMALHSAQQEKEEAGVCDELVKISVGIENIEDLICAFDQVLEG